MTTIDKSRRRFLGTVAAGGVTLVSARPQGAGAQPAARTPRSGTAGKPAVMGGTPVRTAAFPSWPVQDSREEQALVTVLKSGKWGRGGGQSKVSAFEAQYAAATGAAHCLATANGTSALLTAVNALDIGPGDEVIVAPYTFIATVNVILARHALPVFVDTDIETFQIDARKIAAAITDRTRLIVPVHLGGSVVDMDTVMSAAAPRSIPVLEDACQSHLAQWKGRHVGSIGTAGCFSFQASKNLNSGEGGALITSDAGLAERAYAFHNNSRGQGPDAGYAAPGLNLRLTEFQAALLSAQMTRLETQSRQRETNAAYLTQQLAQIPGITPAKMYPGVTRNAYHLYMFRYDPSGFAGLPRAAFLKALRAEGVPASGGYAPLNRERFLASTFATRGYRRIYGEATLREWADRNQTPQNDRLCEQAVWLTQAMLLGPRDDMDQIVEAVRRIQQHAGDIARQSND